jgi:hypothetical protein
MASETGYVRAESCRLNCGPRSDRGTGLAANENGALSANWCTVTGYSLGALSNDGSTAHLGSCTIRDNKSGASAGAREGARPAFLELDRCDVRPLDGNGIEVSYDSAALVRNCRIREGREHGIFLTRGGRARLEMCDITGHAAFGLHIVDRGRLELIECTVRDNGAAGVSIGDEECAAAAGLIEGCRITGTGKCGVRTRDGSELTMRATSVDTGVAFARDARATLERCDVTSGDCAAVQSRDRALVVVRDSIVRGSPQAGVFAYYDGRVELERCEIFGNGEAGVEAMEGGEATVRACRVRDNQLGAVQLYKGGRAHVTSCDLTGNARTSWNLDDTAQLTQRDNRTD